MQIDFYKYQGTGNDFVLLDNRDLHFPKNNTKLIHKMCDRKFGIGADGLILLELHDTADFSMVYYNADGHLSSMCGNGGRCIVHFANYLNVISEDTEFMAVDGLHRATISDGKVALMMNDVSHIKNEPDHSFLDTGSPHHVQMVENLDQYDVVGFGRGIRNNVYGEKGANVNFVSQKAPDVFLVRTYERGVEDETLSCGTGVTAVAIAMHATGKSSFEHITLETPGGKLEVSFRKEKEGYRQVTLIGPATQVFKGVWS